MSGDAIDHARDAQLKAREWDDSRRERMILESQVAAHGMVLQSAGIIPPHTDPEWVFESIEAIDFESLR